MAKLQGLNKKQFIDKKHLIITNDSTWNPRFPRHKCKRCNVKWTGPPACLILFSVICWISPSTLVWNSPFNHSCSPKKRLWHVRELDCLFNLRLYKLGKIWCLDLYILAIWLGNWAKYLYLNDDQVHWFYSINYWYKNWRNVWHLFRIKKTLNHAITWLTNSDQMVRLIGKFYYKWDLYKSGDTHIRK